MEDSTTYTFCEALKEKYSLEKLDDDFENIYIAPNKRTLILQQQNHAERTVLALDGCNINQAGEENEIKKTCPRLTDLDLSHNRFSEILQIIEITNQLDNLTFLNLSHNRLVGKIFTEFPDVQKHVSLKKLVLTKTGVDFDTLVQYLTVFPSVQELHLSLNNFNHIPKCTTVFPSVQTIHFADNGIKNWSNVEHIGLIFPKLKVLYVSENPIESITTMKDKSSEYFHELTKLSITGTNINKWACLEKLNHFPKLIDLRCKHIPVFKNVKNEKTRYNMIMVRLPNLKYINGSEINEDEREDAERKLLRLFRNKEHKPSCYAKLLEVYGELDDLADVNLDKSEIINLTLTGDIEKKMILRFDIGMTCKDVIAHVANIIKLPEKNFRLIAVHSSNPESDRALIDYKTRRLRTYYLEDGDIIEVQRFDT